MLALMPQSPSLSFHAPATLAPSSSISVAILPSAPPACAPNSTTTKPNSSSKRPKLSLNTANVPCLYGKGTSSLRLETLSATSPTSRNTFKNTFSPQAPQAQPAQHISTPTRLTSSPQTLNESYDSDEDTSSHVDDSDYSDRASSSGSSYSAASASTEYSMSDDIPYKLPSDTCSILCNGPLAGARQRTTPRKILSCRKTVGFRSPLTEIVKTTKYVLSNVDLDAMLSPEAAPSQGRASPDRLQRTKKVPRTEEADEDESASCPATPVAGKRKRDRHWVWTLGPSTSDKPTNDGVQLDVATSN